MQVPRLFSFCCALFAFGLFLQPSAYAAAYSADAASAASHCAMMNVDGTADDTSQEEGECEDMQFDCVLGAACFSPLYKPEETSFARSAIQCDRLYAPLSSDEPLTASRGPEPPPPQSCS